MYLKKKMYLRLQEAKGLLPQMPKHFVLPENKKSQSRRYSAGTEMGSYNSRFIINNAKRWQSSAHSVPEVLENSGKRTEKQSKVLSEFF